MNKANALAHELFDDFGLINEVCASSSSYPFMRIYKGHYPMIDHIMMPLYEPTTADISYFNCEEAS
jgi:hypothetical protein